MFNDGDGDGDAISVCQSQFFSMYIAIWEHLTFDEHVNRVRGKLVSAAFMLNQSKSFLPFKTRLQVYRSIF